LKKYIFILFSLLMVVIRPVYAVGDIALAQCIHLNGPEISEASEFISDAMPRTQDETSNHDHAHHEEEEEEEDLRALLSDSKVLIATSKNPFLDIPIEKPTYIESLIWKPPRL
jgi:hypothetical protein